MEIQFILQLENQKTNLEENYIKSNLINLKKIYAYKMYLDVEFNKYE